MTYNVMDQELIEIYRIKNIESIKFYDLTLSGDESTMIVPALLIFYDNGKILNLSSQDKYFDIYVNKVIEVYQEEKDHILAVTPFKVKKIEVDEYSQRILNNCDILNRNHITAFYDDMEGYDNSLLFECDEVKNIIDIVRYEIKEFGIFANLPIQLLDNVRGYRSNYILEANIDNIFTYLLMHYDKVDDNHYVVSIGNLGGINKPFVLEITIMDSYIDIVGHYEDFIINDYYAINSKNAGYIKKVVKNSEVLRYETGNLPKGNPKEESLVNLDCQIDGITWYKLPWSCYYGYKGDCEKIDHQGMIYNNYVIYLDVNQEDFYKREYYTKKVQRNSTVSKIGIELLLDEIRKITFGYRKGPYYIIETGFKNARGDGHYQEKYNGKYYYQIVKAKKTSEIKREGLIKINKSDVVDHIDLLNDAKLKKIGGKI